MPNAIAVIAIFIIGDEILLLYCLALISCKPQIKEKQAFLNTEIPITQKEIIVGANQTARYLPLLEGKRIGIVANQTSVIFKSDSSYTHLVDSLLQLKVDVTTVFSLEHGFRGDADAGEQANDDKDAKTGLPIISLHRKKETLKGALERYRYNDL